MENNEEYQKFEEFINNALMQVIEKRPVRPIDEFISLIYNELGDELQQKNEVLKTFVENYRMNESSQEKPLKITPN